MVRFVDYDKREIGDLEPLLKFIHPLLDPKCSDRGYDPVWLSVWGRSKKKTYTLLWFLAMLLARS
jgi:hypothetical protein